MPNSSDVVFFDIGETLGQARLRFLSATAMAEVRVEAICVYNYVPQVLQDLKQQGLRLGIISNTPPQETNDSIRAVLVAAGIHDLFEPDLLLYSSVIGVRKDSPEIFRRAARVAGLEQQPQRCLFVGEDCNERQFALEAGFRVAPHPLLVEDVLSGSRLRFAQVTVPEGEAAADWRIRIAQQRFVPLRVSGAGDSTIIGIASVRSLRVLDDLGFGVVRLGMSDAPLHCELFLLRDDVNRNSGFLAEEGQSCKFFLSDHEADWVLGSSPEGLLVSLPAGKSIEDYHLCGGHGHNLKLMADISLLGTVAPKTAVPAAASLVVGDQPASLTADEAGLIGDSVTPEQIRHYVSRYSGEADLDDEGRVNNRHSLSEHMPRVQAALAGDFESIGNGTFRVFPHRFNFRGVELLNIVAELPGESEEQVLVTAHLDSTAMSSHPPGTYDPRTDPAPGADDDGSGLAAVLAIAETLRKIYADTKPIRTIRFVLFNAEEQGRVGSQAYARDAALAGELVEAVFQMDTIGFNSDENLTFEVHYGASDRPDVEARSRILAERIDAVRELLGSKLPPPESIGTPDPADGRSDHGSFHAHGIAACVASEDFFAQSGDGPDVNPNYHMATDTVAAVDTAYAAEIARVVAGAAVLTLKS